MVNVFSSIAAGKPIYMSGDVEEKFPLSLGLISGSEDHFILKVKSDRRGCHFERFMKMGDLILLIPENEKYEPIHIRSGQARIIGIAVGIIKRSGN